MAIDVSTRKELAKLVSTANKLGETAKAKIGREENVMQEILMLNNLLKDMLNMVNLAIKEKDKSQTSLGEVGLETEVATHRIF
tara:strand:+ start:780 stop:1028 length:249 start_codon:yes stop_codon:yes gene_type:complete